MRKIYDSMEYQPNMQVLDSDLLEQVLDKTKNFNPYQYTKKDVLSVLEKDNLSISDFAVLLSPAAESCLEKMAKKSKLQRYKYFGGNVLLFTPLYISNYCENECVYCGFNCKNKISRSRLNAEEIEREMIAISKTGMREVLMLTGESPTKSDVEYIAKAVSIAKKYFSTIGLEVYPMNVDDYKLLHQSGADFVTVFQETYDSTVYAEKHPAGAKRCFPYRFYAQERAILGEMRGVGFGVLLGLSDFRKDMFTAAVHAKLLQQKYPHTEIAMSFPRLRPYKNHTETNPNDVHETQLLQMMMAFRLFMPFASITISTRERSGFRDNVLPLCATKISAGVNVGIGGHTENEQKGDAQFEISDPRTLEEIHNAILNQNMQPVYTDYINTSLL
ncbi:MAG: 2-iminoacetate synthase ThiH [Ruminococcus sp.]|nr:2-iminoacetate synthase ThiH [Ruminococcus sp.]